MGKPTFKNKNNYIYWAIIAYLVIGAFFPIVGLLAFICMVAPVAFAFSRGRFWCGNYCPRGSFWDNVMSKVSLGRKAPDWLRGKTWRSFMVVFIFTMFGLQIYFSDGSLEAIGRVFWRIILMTSIVGIVLAWIYAPRTWCTFCPMGSLSALATPKSKEADVKRIHVSSSCVLKCKNCARFCPMGLSPYEARDQQHGYLHYDCIKCERCVSVCPKKAVSL